MRTIVLAAMTSALAIPAAAQQPAPLKLSAAVRTPAAAAQKALAANDLATAEPLIAQAQAAAQTEDERYVAAAMRLNLEVLRVKAGGDTGPLRAPLESLVSNPRTPATDQRNYVYQLAGLAERAKEPAAALRFFRRAQELGHADPDLPLRIVKLQMETGDVAGGSAGLAAFIDAQVAAGRKPDEKLYRFAIARTNDQRLAAETLGWARRYVAAYPTQKVWRDVVVTYGLQPKSTVTLDGKQKIDLYRLLRAAGALDDRYDYELYAQTALDLGLPAEAYAVIDQGRRAGAVPESGAASRAIQERARIQIQSEPTIASQIPVARAAATGRVAAQTGDLALATADYGDAVALYTLALKKGGVDADEVNTRLGIALIGNGDRTLAARRFALVEGGARAGVAMLWRTFAETPVANAPDRLPPIQIAQAPSIPPVSAPATGAPQAVASRPVALPPPAPAPVRTAERRLALVVGNATYGGSFGNLANPVSDATLIAAALKQAGFAVMVITDVDQRTLKRAIAAFGAKLADAGKGSTGLFYYAGHGLQARGANYLVPVGAQIESEADVDLEAVPAESIVRQMEDAGIATSILVFDACRNLPLRRGTRDGSRGLARIDAASGAFISYSTAPGAVAEDGSGANSAFAAALAEEMAKPGQPVEAVFRNVRRQVIARTAGRQVPWDSSSLVEDFVFTARN